MAFIIISSCTQRKRVGLGEPLRATDVGQGYYEDFARKWLRLAQTRQTLPAGELYVGRSISEARKTSQRLDADLRFASTGFGLVGEQQLLPHYDLTVARGSQGLQDVISDRPFSVTRWWKAINEAKECAAPISQLLAHDTACHIFLALSKTYLTLIQDDLMQISECNGSRLRIFTSGDGTKVVPDHLRSSVLPYDDRFDGINSPNPGTRSDFPQRAMQHFVSLIFRPNDPDLAREKSTVVDLMNQLTVRVIPPRIRKSDDELLALMDLHWDRAKGKASLMLRVLRDDLLIACEQKRFAGLFRHLKQQRVASN